MSIEIIDGFKIIPNENGNVLGVESDRLKECMDYAIDKKITAIFIHSFDGYKLSNVEFLKGYDFFKRISITDSGIDMSGVRYLKKLEYLSLSNDRQTIDFSCFPLLNEASIDWNNKIMNLDKCERMKILKIWKYKPKSKSFTELAGLEELKSLEITQSNIESFSGIEALQHLSHLEGHYLSKLESLNGIGVLAKQLKTLILDNCKKMVNNGSELERLGKLEKLILGDCGELDNVNFINKMDNLKFFSFVNTDIKDGNLLPLKEKKLGYVGFNDKRHYSHKMKEINPSFSWDGRPSST